MTDSSGLGNDYTQATEGLRATVTAGHWADGTNALTFDGSDDRYVHATEIVTSGAPFTLAFLIDPVLDVNRYVFGKDANDFIHILSNGSLQIRCGAGSSTVVAAAGSITAAIHSYVLRRASDGTTSLRRDGAEVGNGANVGTNAFTLQLIADGAGTNFSGEMGEVVFVDDEVTGSDLANLEALLARGVA